MLSVTMNSGVGTKGIGTLVCSDIHSKLPLESCENEFGMIPVIIWYEYHYFSFCSELIAPILTQLTRLLSCALRAAWDNNSPSIVTC